MPTKAMLKCFRVYSRTWREDFTGPRQSHKKWKVRCCLLSLTPLSSQRKSKSKDLQREIIMPATHTIQLSRSIFWYPLLIPPLPFPLKLSSSPEKKIVYIHTYRQRHTPSSLYITLSTLISPPPLSFPPCCGQINQSLIRSVLCSCLSVVRSWALFAPQCLLNEWINEGWGWR